MQQKKPARVRRSRLRLEQFLKRKEETKNKTESAAGETSSSDNKLVIELNKEEDRVEEVVSSPILKVEGPIYKEQLMKFKFVSNFAKEDIEYTLDKIFPEENFDLQTLKFKTVYTRLADYLYTALAR